MNLQRDAPAEGRACHRDQTLGTLNLVLSRVGFFSGPTECRRAHRIESAIHRATASLELRFSFTRKRLPACTGLREAVELHLEGEDTAALGLAPALRLAVTYELPARTR